MAAPIVNPSRDHFPLSFAELLIEQLDHFTDQVSRRVERHLDCYLTECSNPDFPCQNFGVVHLIESEEDLCRYHFEKRLRGSR